MSLLVSDLQIGLPRKIWEAYKPPRGAVRYRAFYGGRGSGKSYSVALMAALWGTTEKLRFLCTREYQNSIKESFHAELKNAIASNDWLAEQYDVGVDYLRHKTNGTEFIFKGLRSNIESVKSMAQIDVCIIEEAETVPPESWRALLPTIRATKSELWLIWNPKRRDSWVSKTFLLADALPPRTHLAQVNHGDNPFFPPVLEEQRAHDESTLDPALYRHVWMGEFYEQSDSQVFAGRWRVGDFEPQGDWGAPMFGLDFGFSQDPTAAVKCWVHESKLYIEADYSRVGLELDSTAEELMRVMPGIERHKIVADNARPESISYLKRHGLPMVAACKKGKGSVEDGIIYLKTFKEIVIHPRAKSIATEFERYSYKVDRQTGAVLPEVVDAYNHGIDALRYALEDKMRARGGFMFGRA